MSETTTDDAVASYLTSLRAALDDLPSAEVEEILDDVGPHLGEVAAELGEEDLQRHLSERLGEPAQYAAELRAAAGYPPQPAERPKPAEAPRRLIALRVALWLLIAAIVLCPLLAVVVGDGVGNIIAVLLLAAVPAVLSLVIVLRSPGGIAAFAELPELRWLRARNPGGAVADYARLLQPGWWLVRAGVATLLIVALLGIRPAALLVVLASVPLVLGSVWVGRRSQADRRWLWAVLPLNAFAVFVALAVLDRAPVEHGRYAEFSDPAVVPVPAFSNIYPFDSSGRPLSGVFLYDENSQPLTTPYPAGECVPRDRVPVPANRYPQPVYRVDPTGGCVPRSDVPSPSLPAAPGATSPGATGTPPSATVTPPATPEAPATPTS